MASSGDCVLRSATQIPSLRCSGLERLGNNWTVATKIRDAIVLDPGAIGVLGDVGVS
jgi:hypothetical protein